MTRKWLHPLQKKRTRIQFVMCFFKTNSRNTGGFRNVKAFTQQQHTSQRCHGDELAQTRTNGTPRQNVNFNRCCRLLVASEAHTTTEWQRTNTHTQTATYKVLQFLELAWACLFPIPTRQWGWFVVMQMANAQYGGFVFPFSKYYAWESL